MNTNVLVAFIKTRGLTRSIILNADLQLFTIPDVLEELKQNEPEWNRGQLSAAEVGRLLDLLPNFIAVVPKHAYAPRLSAARRVMGKIDERDAPILAAALALRCAVWSSDQHFRRQKRVGVYNTKELAQLLRLL